jgi:hypothetical protein
MNRPLLTACLAVCLLLTACRHHPNPSIGNDTEAALDPPEHAAAQRTAAQALTGVSMQDVQPETMGQADLDSLGGTRDRCLFRLDADGWPSFVYGGAQNGGVLKLNESLINLPRVGLGVFADSGLQVTLRPLDKKGQQNDQWPAELVIRLPHTEQELGFLGYSECRGQAMKGAEVSSGT